MLVIAVGREGNGGLALSAVVFDPLNPGAQQALPLLGIQGIPLLQLGKWPWIATDCRRGAVPEQDCSGMVPPPPRFSALIPAPSAAGSRSSAFRAIPPDFE